MTCDSVIFLVLLPLISLCGKFAGAYDFCEVNEYTFNLR